MPWQRVFGEKDRIIDHAAGNGATKKEKQKFADAYGRLKDFLDGTYSALLGDSYDGTRLQREQLRRMTSQLIDKYIRAISINPDSSTTKAVVFNDDSATEILILKQITRDYIIGSPTLAAQQHGQRRIITDLFEALWEGHDRELGYPPFLPVRLRFLAEVPNTSRARFVADCIASLSESEATALHARLFGAIPGSVLNPIVR